MTTSTGTSRLQGEKKAVERDIATAREVLNQGSKALAALADMLDDRFAAAVRILSGVSGRVIVAGIGKSGHVARKVAATLASTGTPSQFVHPSEASHGDLGMVTEHDAVMLFSKSGENGELADIVAYSKRFRIPLIAITGDSASTLGRAASVVLELPDIPEASPRGVAAPTTSTTMMMALGDAVAVALLDRKDFSADHFRILHPGGRLGAALVRVADLMRVGDELPLVESDTPMSEVLLVMSAKNFGCAGIVDGNNSLVGIITDGDLRRHMSNGLLELSAKQVMTTGVKTIGPEALAAEAVAVMAGKITNLFVVEKGRVVGILRLHDCLQAGVA